jgi:hypothetical protein
MLHTPSPQSNGTGNLMRKPLPQHHKHANGVLSISLTSSYSYDRPFSSCHQNRGSPLYHYYCHDHMNDDPSELTLHS